MTRLIAITGGSCACKTTVALALGERLGERARVIAEDDYYRCSTTFPNFDPAKHNFDEPAAKDHALLVAHLREARASAGFAKPLYDLVTHTRRAESEFVQPEDVLIVEGLHLLATPALREAFDLRVYVEADEALRLGRRMIRDVEERGRTPRSVLNQFFNYVRPMHELHVAPQRAFADLVLRSEPEHTLDMARDHAALIQQRLDALG